MDNLGELSGLLGPLLSDPAAMESLREAAKNMGLGGLLPDTAPEAPPAVTQVSTALDTPLAGLSPDLLSMVAKLSPMLGGKNDDDASRLLCALRPFLSDQRAKKLDEAERLLSVTRVLSILKESKLM